MNCDITTDIARAADALAGGQLVAFATETVYGLGADVFNESALARVFAVKNRPHFDPLIVHIAHVDWVDRLAVDLPPHAQKLADEFWPGPLTLVVAKLPQVPDLATSGLPTVAIRQPAHSVARELILQANCPVAAPSANKFGRLSPTSAEHVAEQLGDQIDLILDGGPCAVGIESTVIDATGDTPTLLRPGGIPLEAIEQICGRVELMSPNAAESAEPQTSPGMLKRHYSPSTPLRIVESLEDVSFDRRTGFLGFAPQPNLPDFEVIEILSQTADLQEAAANFFAAMRRLDAAGLDLIVACRFPNHGLGRALNDRLDRAAHR